MTRRRGGEDPDRRRLGRVYQGGFEAVLAVVLALVLGIFADSRLGTSPVFLLVGLVLGFGTFVLRLVRLVRALEEPPEGGTRPSGEG